MSLICTLVQRSDSPWLQRFLFIIPLGPEERCVGRRRTRWPPSCRSAAGRAWRWARRHRRPQIGQAEKRDNELRVSAALVIERTSYLLVGSHTPAKGAPLCRQGKRDGRAAAYLDTTLVGEVALQNDGDLHFFRKTWSKNKKWWEKILTNPNRIPSYLRPSLKLRSHVYLWHTLYPGHRAEVYDVGQMSLGLVLKKQFPIVWRMQKDG